MTHTDDLVKIYADAAQFARQNAQTSRRDARSGLKLQFNKGEDATKCFKCAVGYLDQIRRFKANEARHGSAG